MRTIKKNSKEATSILADTNISWYCHDSESCYKAKGVTPEFVIDQYRRFKSSKLVECNQGPAPIDYIIKITGDFWFQGVRISKEAS
jgi:hypothetical protein